jgi:hypothetical protein
MFDRVNFQLEYQEAGGSIRIVSAYSRFRHMLESKGPLPGHPARIHRVKSSAGPPSRFRDGEPAMGRERISGRAD